MHTANRYYLPDRFLNKPNRITTLSFSLLILDLRENKQLLEIIYLVLIAGNFLNAVSCIIRIKAN